MGKLAEVTPFFQLNFKDAKRYLPTVYLNLGFLKDLDIKTLDLKVIYTNTTIIPIFIANGTGINKYVFIGPTEDEIARKEVDLTQFSKMMFLGYKHFDKCKQANGKQIGDLQSSLDKEYVTSKKIQRQIQRNVMGFWGYWKMRIFK